jgi:hypothetical protein
MEIYLLTALIASVGLFIWNHEQHKKEVKEIYQKAHDERKELLDRIMANNIHEYKAASGIAQVKKSESGNFLVDRMTKGIKSQFQDFE